MNPRYAFVALRAGHRCEYCHAPEVIFNSLFEVEHIIPLALAGVDSSDNLALACRSCNLKKAVHVEHRDPVTQTIVRLFNPRRDSWSDYFRVEVETGLIEGLGPVGRATVEKLGMNTPAQREARRLWNALGLFP
jgi:hypothetical protein